MMQDTGCKIQDKKHKSCIVHHASWFMHRASCIVHHDRRGVTLVELIIVIAIIGIIALFATIDTGWFQKDARVTEARDRLLADIEDAKLQSLAKIPYGIIVTGGNNTSYRIVKLTDLAGADFKRDTPADDASFSDITGSPVNLQTNCLKCRVMLTGLTSGDEVWFDRKGIPRTNNWAATVNATFTIWYDADGGGGTDVDGDEISKTITISQDGRIRYE